MLQLGLEAHHVPQGAERIVLPQLDHRIGLLVRLVGVGQADGLHGPVAQGFAAPLGHDLDGQAAVEIGDVLPVLELGLRPGQQGVDKGLVLVPVHGAVDIGRSVAAGAYLVIAGLAPADVHVHRLQRHDGRNGVEEGQLALAGQVEDCLRQGRRGERAGGDNDAVPRLGRQAGDLAAVQGNVGMGQQPCGHRVGEPVAVDGQGAARRNLMGVAAGHDDRVQPAHLGVQQADCASGPVVGAERVGADQLGQLVRLVGVCAAHGAHFVQDHGDAGLGDLPGGLGTGQAAADDMNRREAHEGPHSNDLRTSRAGPCRRPGRAPSFSAHGRRLQAVQAFGARIGELR